MDNFNKCLEEAENDTELNDLKTWLFKENIRVQMEKQELCDLRDRLKEQKRELCLEKESFDRKIDFETKRIQSNEQMIGQKQKILENGFRQLAIDKNEFEKRLRQNERRQQEIGARDLPTECELLFFRGVSDTLALKKRYKDLLKIYHPDNRAGDQIVVCEITKEYEELKERYYDDI